MHKRIVAFLCALPLALSGCAETRQIESAAIIENVSVERLDGKLCYTFYLLSGKEVPESVTVPAKSFEQAQGLAKRQYIPNMSLAKLELLLIRKDVMGEIMQSDIEYISTQASFSPVAYVTLCDSGALEKVKHSAHAQEWIEKQLLLCKSNHPEMCINYLSVFNRYADDRCDCFSVPYVTAAEELRVTEMMIRK